MPRGDEHSSRLTPVSFPNVGLPSSSAASHPAAARPPVAARPAVPGRVHPDGRLAAPLRRGEAGADTPRRTAGDTPTRRGRETVCTLSAAKSSQCGRISRALLETKPSSALRQLHPPLSAGHLGGLSARGPAAGGPGQWRRRGGARAPRGLGRPPGARSESETQHTHTQSHRLCVHLAHLSLCGCHSARALREIAFFTRRLVPPSTHHQPPRQLTHPLRPLIPECPPLRACPTRRPSRSSCGCTARRPPPGARGSTSGRGPSGCPRRDETMSK